jgi:iron complex outermembrane recepter protein
MRVSSNTILLCTASTLFLAAPALAQQATTPPAGSSAEVEAIVVTAQRRTENLQQTPLAITAMSTQALKDANVATTMDLMRLAPGLQVSTASSGQGTAAVSIFIRGMGQERSTNGQGPAVGVYVDDFYYPSLDGQLFNIVDLQDVEVLRGPQGTLFGRGTIGGAVRYTSQQPDFGGLSGHVDATYGSYERHDLTGAINIPLTSNLALRLTAGSLDTNGYVKVEAGGRDAGANATELGRVQLRWQPAPNLDIELGGQYTRDRDYGFTYAIRSLTPAAFGSAAQWNIDHASQPALLYNSQWVSSCTYCQPGSDLPEGSDTHYYNATAKITWKIGDTLTLKSLTSYQKIDNTSVLDTDGTPLPIQSADPQIDNHTAVSQEFQLSGAAFDNRLNWVAGAYFYHENWDYILIAQQYAATPDNGLYYEHTTTTAGFLDANFALTDKVKLIGGIRYSSDAISADLEDLSGNPETSAKKTFPKATWRGGVQVQWTADAMSYATVSTGFRAGGFSEDGGVISTFEPETATNYEVGTRLELFGHRLRFNPTAFYTKWTNMQIQWQVQTPTFLRYFVMENAAKAHSYGGELEAEALLTGKLRLFGNLALLHMQYDSVGDAQGITVNSHFERAPTATYTVGARYQTPIFGNYTARATINWNWQSVQYSSPTDDDQLRLPSYGVLGARIELTDPSKKWNLAIYGTNLTNTVYYVGGLNYGPFIGESEWYLGRPREFGVSLRRNF